MIPYDGNDDKNIIQLYDAFFDRVRIVVIVTSTGATGNRYRYRGIGGRYAVYGYIRWAHCTSYANGVYG